MNLTAAKLRERFKGLCRHRIRGRAYGKSHKKLVCVKSGIVISKHTGLKLLDGFYYSVGDQLIFIRDIG